MRASRILTVLAMAWMGVISTGVADDSGEKEREDFDAKALTSKWALRAGGNLSSFDTSVAWSPGGFGGAIVILEDTLGLESSTDTYELGAAYRFNGRHSIELGATDVRRSAFAVIDEEIEWGDYIYRAHGEVFSELDMSVVGLKYKYDFSGLGRLNAGFSMGLSVFSIDASLSGEARLEDDDEGEWIEGVVEQADVLAPVPLVGFFLEYAATPRWILRFSAEVIDLDVSGHEGRLFQTGMAIEYSFTDTFGVGVRMGGMDLEYRTDKKDEIFGVNYSVKSLGAYLAFVF